MHCSLIPLVIHTHITFNSKLKLDYELKKVALNSWTAKPCPKPIQCIGGWVWGRAWDKAWLSQSLLSFEYTPTFTLLPLR